MGLIGRISRVRVRESHRQQGSTVGKCHTRTEHLDRIRAAECYGGRGVRADSCANPHDRQRQSAEEFEKRNRKVYGCCVRPHKYNRHYFSVSANHTYRSSHVLVGCTDSPIWTSLATSSQAYKAYV